MTKVNANYQRFFRNAALAGYAGSDIISFLQNMFKNPSAQRESGEDYEGLRPDEQANIRGVQSGERPMNAIKSIPGMIGRAGAMGTAIGAAPDLLKKGLQLFGHANAETPMEEGGEAGKDIQKSLGINSKDLSGKNQPINSDFSMSPQDPTVPKQKSGSNIIKEPEQGPDFSGQVMDKLLKDFPQLGRFLQSRISAGASPTEAAFEAKQKRTFQESIQKFESKIGPLEDALEFLFGGGQRQQQRPQQSGANKASFMQGLGELAKIMQGLKR